MKSKHSVNFIGAGIWKDSKGEAFYPNKPHEFESEKSEAEFLEERGDIKFMVEYGQMTIATVSVEEENKEDGKAQTGAVPPVEPGKPIIK